MIAIVTVLTALPLGYLVRSRTAAYLAYAVAYLWAFVFQSVYLLVDFVGGDRSAFRPDAFPWEYGVVAAGVLTVGLGLVTLGRRVAERRDARSVVRVA